MIILNPLWLLVTVIALCLWCFVSVFEEKDDWHHVIHGRVLHYLRKGLGRSRKRITGFALVALSAIALASPSVNRLSAENYQHSHGWFVLMDISRSMTLEDISPNRLSAARDLALLLARHAGSRAIALVAYAGDAFVVAPPSFEIGSFEGTVSILEHGLIDTEGSNLTRALAVAASSIENSKMLNSRLFVITDSGGINAKAISAAGRFKALGHRIDVLLLGSSETAENAPFEPALATELAKAGGGMVLHSNAMGMVEIDQLKLQALNVSGNGLVPSDIALLKWENLSHWLLLFGVPLLLLMFYRDIQ